MKVLLKTAGFLLVAAVGGAAAGTYTLQDLVEHAWRTSPDVKSVQEEMNKTDAQVREAYGSALPKIDLSVNYQYAFAQYNPLASGDMDMSAFQSAIQSIGDASRSPSYTPTLGDTVLAGYLDEFIGYLMGVFPEETKQTLVWSIAIQQPLFAQGKVGIGLKIAKYYRTQLDDKMKDTKNSVRANVTKMFYGSLLAADNVNIREQAVSVAEESRRLAVLRFTAGTGTELDTLAAAFSLQQARTELRKARGDLNMAYAALISQAGIDDTPDVLQLTGELPAADYTVVLDDALGSLNDRNLVLKQLASAGDIQDELVKLARSDYYPMVYCGANVGQLALFNAGDELVWNDDQNVFVGMSVNLFSGGITRQKIKQAKADREIFTQTRQKAADGLALAVRNAYEQLETARENLTATEAMVRLAEKGYDVTNTSYEVGMATLVELQKAESQMKGSKLALNGARMQFTSAEVDMRTLLDDLNR